LTFIFNLKFIVSQIFSKWRPSEWASALDFLWKEDFPQSSYTHVVLCMNRILPEQKKRFPDVLCAFSNTGGAKIRQFALLKIPLSEEMALWRVPPAVSYHHAGANCSVGNPGLKHPSTDTILKKIDRKMNFRLKINVQLDLTNFKFIQLHHLQPSPIL
jgi:hypothetical protein